MASINPPTCMVPPLPQWDASLTQSQKHTNAAVVRKSTSSVSTKTDTTASSTTCASDDYYDENDDASLMLLPILRHAFPSAYSYTVLGTILQPNAAGYKLNVRLETTNSDDDETLDETDVFLKQVVAKQYVFKREWLDVRRTLLYARTEIRFYDQVLSLLRQRGFEGHTPRVFYANYDFQGWIDESELATSPPKPETDVTVLADAPDADEKGGYLVLECVSDDTHYQDSPLTVEQSKQCLEAVAHLHASAWEDVQLLQQAETTLSKASFHLTMRNPKELANIADTWDKFVEAFETHLVDAGLMTDSLLQMGKRVEVVAQYVSKQVSPTPTDKYATIIHGDYKSMNAFLPKDTEKNKALLVDFASCGIGLGMSDLAMHIHHAVLPHDLDNGGEEEIVRHYWEYLCSNIKRHDGAGEYDAKTYYPWDLAWKQYKVAVVDYFRFFLARMWKNATPETMQKKANNKNVNLINRNIPAAITFIRTVEQFLTEVEADFFAEKHQRRN